MQPYSVNELREKFLSFFESKEHLRMPSFPLVPHNDNSLLLINAGMTPLKPYFTGQEIPPSKRVTTCQKCVRTVDIDEVGRNARHLSFFQMLGNFSFADYFKEEIIFWSWEYMTEVLEIPADKLYVSVYEEDDEAYDIWHKKVGLGTERIFRLGKDDNFWEHGTGPCGPCSEIHFDRGPEHGCSPNCVVGCDCDRYMELWNLVFIQFNKNSDGTYDELPAKGIDTGMGLERIATIMQKVNSVHEIDTFAKSQKLIRELTGTTKKTDEKTAISVNIINDHLRSIVFMASDGILPSNEGRGYILRRLLRRAVRHVKLLGRSEPFIAQMCPLIIEESAKAYPELEERRAHIIQVLSNEEERFLTTLDTGTILLEELCGELRKSGKKVLPGAEAFRLYDTYGFPPELTGEMLEEQGFTYDEQSFNTEMENQRARARAARSESNYMGADETVFNKLDASLVTEFVGYTSLTANSKVIALAVGQNLCDKAQTGDEVAVFLDKTPFYAESGGQKGDHGLLRLPAGLVEVHDCIKVIGAKTAHLGIVKEGSISVNDMAEAEVDQSSRQMTACNHTATHLLNKALRKVLGEHVEQAGSEVSPGRLRFDFTHFAGISAEDLRAVEDDVNANIFAGLNVEVKEMSMDEARKAGAVMLMGEKGEKYGDYVRVVNIGGISIELCGGTHISNTAQAGLFKLVSEGSVAAGIRRIEALTGAAALSKYREAESQLFEAASAMKAAPDQLLTRIQAVNAELRQVKQELESIKSKMAAGQAGDILDKKEEYAGMLWLSACLPDLDAAGLRTISDQLKEKVDVLLLASSIENGPVQFISHASQKAVDSGVHAGNIVKEAATICGGNGGGRPNSAQAGGKDSSKTQEALLAGIAKAKSQLKATTI